MGHCFMMIVLLDQGQNRRASQCQAAFYPSQAEQQDCMTNSSVTVVEAESAIKL